MTHSREADAIQEAIRVRTNLAIGLQDLLQAQSKYEELAASLKEAERDARRVGLRDATQALVVENANLDQCSAIQSEMNTSFRNISSDIAMIAQQVSLVMAIVATVDQTIADAQKRIEQSTGSATGSSTPMPTSSNTVATFGSTSSARHGASFHPTSPVGAWVTIVKD